MCLRSGASSATSPAYARSHEHHDRVLERQIAPAVWKSPRQCGRSFNGRAGAQQVQHARHVVQHFAGRAIVAIAREFQEKIVEQHRRRRRRRRARHRRGARPASPVFAGARARRNGAFTSAVRPHQHADRPGNARNAEERRGPRAERAMPDVRARGPRGSSPSPRNVRAVPGNGVLFPTVLPKTAGRSLGDAGHQRRGHVVDVVRAIGFEPRAHGVDVAALAATRICPGAP